MKKISLAVQIAILGVCGYTTVHARGEVSVINTDTEAATPYSYTKEGHTYNWGLGNNLKIVSFVYSDATYEYRNLADRVVIRRVDDPDEDNESNSTGQRCTLFAERSSQYNYKANYPTDGTDSGNCDMAKVMAGRTINLGALDVFANKGFGNNPIWEKSIKNIERVDFIFSEGIISPDSSFLDETGHVVTEKSGNNPVKIAAILSLDNNGDPASYGSLVLVNHYNACNGEANADKICYGVTNVLTHNEFLGNEANPAQTQPSYIRDVTENLGMAFVSLDDLGVPELTRYYGFSYFGSDTDTDEGHILADPSSFPLDSLNGGINTPGDADMYGGVAGYFVNEDCSNEDCPGSTPALTFGSEGRLNIREINALKISSDEMGAVEEEGNGNIEEEEEEEEEDDD